MGFGMFEVANPVDKAMSGMQGAASTAAHMQRAVPQQQEPEKTAGGALSGAMGGAATGAAIGSIVPGIGTGIGAIGGAVVGATAYMLS
ncbi:hypothetical protein [Maridesulfovibrio frigidus]|uniref:hypothetical protein n=1 Tax=Maridesulfovibrio frigidus TaxID=340956 RepID=UPI0004E19760|nr:hypothetical protein [Maridesulfovibrio frigidus]